MPHSQLAKDIVQLLRLTPLVPRPCKRNIRCLPGATTTDGALDNNLAAFGGRLVLSEEVLLAALALLGARTEELPELAVEGLLLGDGLDVSRGRLALLGSLLALDNSKAPHVLCVDTTA
eukprot:TRINITY_DN14403_c0_g1_i3.p1 TRINITY_DN14403_c0_g1~~TRINITY_DN14403_c0_g1_i3.p1  ORF type:complete len:119 (-),score=14.78 TRINITY_DN14403_c0_g1_i3:5-361(-)